MNLLPKNKEEFSQVSYWDHFFRARGTKGFEWYGEYPELCEYLHKYIKSKDEILMVGCGNSNLSNDLYDVGVCNIINIDISSVVIKQMQKTNHKRPKMQFILMDAMKMDFPAGRFPVVLDKGTLDALMPDDSPETVVNIEQYFSEILRVLSTGGRYICISLLQSHILRMLLSYFPSHNCIFRIARCFQTAEDKESLLPVFMVICTKFKELKTPILEIGLSADGAIQRINTPEEIIGHIKDAQRTEFICAGLRKGSLVDEQDVAIDLFQPENDAARFTIYIVDIQPKRDFMHYAAFIVPQGREAEWLFSTHDGRRKIATESKSNRLAIITMHRNHLYTNMKAVQDETAEYVKNLAPIGFKDKILFLSLGSEVGHRHIQYKGRSEFSGDYVIEDVEIYEDNKYRRLYYLCTQLLIQSEARLKSAKTRKGNIKEIVDLTYLTCKHHVYMSIGCQVTCLDAPSRILVIGLGGGGLCMFLRKFLPSAEITVVDIDDHMLQVATKWFGLVQDDKLKVVIQDGLEYLKQCDNKGEKFDAILFDVDNKDTSTGMSCPPKQFLEANILQHVVNSLSDDGIFILNMVLRNELLRPSILEKLKTYFKLIIPYKLQEDLNEVIACSKQVDTDLRNKFLRATKNIRTYFERNSYPVDEISELDDFLNKLKI